MARPWCGRLYDFVGIIGHYLGRPSINTPGLHYCSEYAMRVLAVVDPDAAEARHYSPAQIDAWIRARPERYAVAAVYDPYPD